MLASAGLRLPNAHAATTGSQEPHAFTKEIRKSVTLNYLLYLPSGYGQDTSMR